MSEYEQPRIRPSSVQNHGIKPPTTKKRPPEPPSQTSKKTIIKYETLVEASNNHHNVIYDYIEAHGADEKFQVHVQGQYYWLKLIAERNGFEIE